MQKVPKKNIKTAHIYVFSHPYAIVRAKLGHRFSTELHIYRIAHMCGIAHIYITCHEKGIGFGFESGFGAHLGTYTPPFKFLFKTY
jgi:hypothetical protein